MSILGWILFGLIVGVVGKFLMPGRDPGGFVITILLGIAGALLGGLIVGVAENLAAAYISPAYKDAVALVVFMLVILFKPQGLLGKKEERKV